MIIGRRFDDGTCPAWPTPSSGQRRLPGPAGARNGRRRTLNHSHVLPTRKADQTIADKRRPAPRARPANPDTAVLHRVRYPDTRRHSIGHHAKQTGLLRRPECRNPTSAPPSMRIDGRSTRLSRGTPDQCSGTSLGATTSPSPTRLDHLAWGEQMSRRQSRRPPRTSRTARSVSRTCQDMRRLILATLCISSGLRCGWRAATRWSRRRCGSR